MNESKVGENVGSVGVSNADYWHWHLGAEDVGHVQEIASMIAP